METTSQAVTTQWETIRQWDNEQKMQLVELIIASIPNDIKKKADEKGLRYISPRLKALETGEDHSVGLSRTYRKELNERKNRRARI